MMKFKRFFAVLLCFVIFVSAWAMQVSAQESIDVTKDITFTVEFRDGARAITGAEFLIYKLGAFDENGQLTVQNEFANYPVEIDLSDDPASRNTALTLEGYILRDELAPYDRCKTDINGIAAFPNEKDSLKPGAYLVVSADFVENDTAYISLPFIAVLPAYGEDGTALSYDVTAVPKYETLSVDGEGISRKVVKVWDDENNVSARPEKVTVDLLCNGEVFDTVVLRSDNNWRYEWDGLDESCHWTVVERETEGYTVEVSREESLFVITNTSQTETDDGNKDDEKLPQTGQLWWPVPVLLALGVLLIVFGAIRRRGVK